jgi:beta-glucosidase
VTPEPFLWGVATAAYQTEGARMAGGRTPSIWDVFPRKKIHDGSDAEIATRSYETYEEDLAALRAIGLDAYRSSVAWPRVMADGGRTINEAGIDFYKRLADGLNAIGVIPFATLYHWDLPEAL